MASAKRLWLGLTAAFMVNGMFYGVWASRIPAVAKEFSLSHNALGLLLLLLALGAILCFPIAGRMSDRYGAPLVTRVLTVGKAASMFGMAVSPNVGFLAASLFVFGASHGGMDVAMNAWASDVEKVAKRTWMPSFHAMWSFGAGLGAVSGYLAVSADLTYATHFMLTSILVPIIGFWGMNIAWQSTRVVSQEKPPLFPIPRGMLLLVGIFAFCTTIGEGAMADWSAIYLIEVTMAEEQIAPIGLAVFSAAMVGMRLMGGIVIASLGATRAGIGSAISAILGTAMVVFAPTVTVAMIGFLLMGCGYALAMPIAFSRAGNDPNTPPAQAIASVATLGYGGILLGPPIIGFLAEGVSLRGAFSVLLILAVVMLVIAPSIKTDTSQTADAT